MPKRTTKNRSIEVIVLQADKHLGERYEIIKVKPVYARNILLPKGIVVLADTNNKNKYAQKMVAAETERKNKAKGLDELFMKIQNDGGLVLVRKANKENHLYAKVDEHDIVKAIQEKYGIEVEAHNFKMKNKLAAIGQFNVPFLYKELKKDIPIKIEADPEEAKKHAKTDGKASEANAEVISSKAKTKEEIRVEKEKMKAEKEAKRAIEKAETIKKLKEKYK
jgi:ribosomal protein L9